MRKTLISVAIAVVASGASAQYDVIKLSKGSPIRARVWEQGPNEVTFNVYGTGIRSVTNGTEKLPAKSVKQVLPDPDPHHSFWRRFEQLKDGSAEEWCQLGLEAEKNKLRGLAREAFTEALVRDPKHAVALKSIDSKAKEIFAADPRLNAALQSKLAAYLDIKDFAAREAAYRELQALGCTWPLHYLERAVRSAKEKKGRTDDRLLTLRSKEHKGQYTIFVPANYDPLRPTPLVVGLHGGGAGGKDGKAVVGSGPSAMNFYQTGGSSLGWIVVCPTAIQAPWSNEKNDGFVLSVVDEACMLLNVDRNRIYLTGHSMGGFGCWHFGPLYAHLWAAIAPMAGGGRPNLHRLEETMTGVYLYHGANDPVVSVDGDRALAAQMKNAEMDFVYAEIPDSGHGFPNEVEKEMWEFFKPRRLAVTPDRGAKGKFTVTEETESSFLQKPGKDEIAYFGAVGRAAAEETPAQEAQALLKDLKQGGGLARQAAEKLAAMKDPALATRVGALVSDASLPVDTRRFAAEALGGMGQPVAIKSLQKALADESLDVISAAALSLGKIPSPDTPKAYGRCLKDLKPRFDKKLAGTTMDFSDFESHLATVTCVVEGATRLADPASLPAINQAATGFLFAPVDVDASQRAGQNPALPRRALARALVAAYEGMRDATVKPILEGLISRTDLGVAEKAQELLGTMK